MSTIEDTLREMAEEDNPARMPLIEVVVTVQEDVTFQEAQVNVGGIRQEVLGADPIVSNVTHDHTVDSFAAETASALSWEDVQNVRSAMRNAVRDAGYTIRGSAVQATVKERTF